jgi:hypothetical protein
MLYGFLLLMLVMGVAMVRDPDSILELEIFGARLQGLDVSATERWYRMTRLEGVALIFTSLVLLAICGYVDLSGNRLF